MLKSSQYFSMYTPVLIYITVLAHACAWEDKTNYNRIDSYDTGTIGHSYKNTNVKSSQYFSMYTPVLIYILAHCISTCLCLINYNRERNDQLHTPVLIYITEHMPVLGKR